MINESVHGVYSLQLVDRLVYCDFSEGFNLTGVRALTQDVLQLTDGLVSWGVYQKPEPSAGIAHNAIIEMMNSYVTLQMAGCKAVAILDNSLFVRVGAPHHPPELTIPIKIHKDEQVLLKWLTAIVE